MNICLFCLECCGRLYFNLNCWYIGIIPNCVTKVIAQHAFSILRQYSAVFKIRKLIVADIYDSWFCLKQIQVVCESKSSMTHLPLNTIVYIQDILYRNIGNYKMPKIFFSLPAVQPAQRTIRWWFMIAMFVLRSVSRVICRSWGWVERADWLLCTMESNATFLSVLSFFVYHKFASPKKCREREHCAFRSGRLNVEFVRVLFKDSVFDSASKCVCTSNRGS